jgi:hypothetical protein
LCRSLRHYGEIYRATYGNTETVAELVPFMLDAFIESDRGFAKARKDGMIETNSPRPDESVRRGRRVRAASRTTANEEA